MVNYVLHDIDKSLMLITYKYYRCIIINYYNGQTRDKKSKYKGQFKLLDTKQTPINSVKEIHEKHDTLFFQSEAIF